MDRRDALRNADDCRGCSLVAVGTRQATRGRNAGHASLHAASSRMRGPKRDLVAGVLCAGCVHSATPPFRIYSCLRAEWHAGNAGKRWTARDASRGADIFGGIGSGARRFPQCERHAAGNLSRLLDRTDQPTDHSAARLSEVLTQASFFFIHHVSLHTFLPSRRVGHAGLRACGGILCFFRSARAR